MQSALRVLMPFTAICAILSASGTHAADSEIKFYDFQCEGIQRYKEEMTRTVKTEAGSEERAFKCVDRSCFHWSIRNEGTENEAHLIEHVFIKEKEHSYVLSWMVRNKQDAEPIYTYSRTKQLLNCTSPTR